MFVPHDDKYIQVLAKRLDRLREALFDLAGGDLERMRSFELGDDDDFAAIEHVVLAFSREFVAAKLRTRELEAKNAEVIARQAALIETLTVPILQLAAGVIAVPVVGTLDEVRMNRLSTSVLERIVAEGTRYVLVDLSGATEVRAETLQDLTKLWRAVGLVGAECLVTGISASLAAAITTLEADVNARTFRTLGAGLSYCLA